MTDAYSERFMRALAAGDPEGVRRAPKSDLHNHFVLGGDRAYIRSATGIDIPPLQSPLHSMDEMHDWYARHLGERFGSAERRILLIRAAFAQAKNDGVQVLEIGEDVWGLDEFFHGDVRELVKAFREANEREAPEVALRLQIGLSRHCPIAYLEEQLEKFLASDAFYSIDLYGDELAQPIERFVPLYRMAGRRGLRLKAHIGEWGTAEDVVRAVELLELNEVQHGIAAADSPEVMKFLRKNHIRLNVTPTSNVMLGRVPDMRGHPIGKLFRAGLDVTINSDDVLIFDSAVSKEYLRLFQCGALTAEELDAIRVNGLRTL